MPVLAELVYAYHPASVCAPLLIVHACVRIAQHTHVVYRLTLPPHTPAHYDRVLAEIEVII
jgi:BarA-like signal transduction histidine kinase